MADLANLDAEGQRLRGKLLDLDNRASKLHTYIEVSQEYGVVSASADKHTSSDERRTSVHVKPVSDRGVTQTAVETSIEFLEAKGAPIHTRELLKMLAERNIEIRGGNPVANLSGFLSREKERLSNSRTDGWSLRKWRANGAHSPQTNTDASEHAGNDGSEPAMPDLSAHEN